MNEQNVSVIIDALVSKIKSLEVELWVREERIAKLKAQLGEKVGADDGKL